MKWIQGKSEADIRKDEMWAFEQTKQFRDKIQQLQKQQRNLDAEIRAAREKTEDAGRSPQQLLQQKASLAEQPEPPSETSGDTPGKTSLIFGFWHQEPKLKNQWRDYAVMGGEWSSIDAT